MKIIASRKTIVILTTCFVLILLAFAAFSYSDVVRNGLKYNAWFTLGKYNDLLEHCEFKNKGKNITIKCQALLKEVKEGDNANCYLSTIIPKVQKLQLIDYTFCGNDTVINFDDNYIFEGKYIPANLEIIFKDPIPGIANLELLNISRMDDLDFYKIVESYEKIRIDSFEGRITTKSGYPSIEAYQNYVLQKNNAYPSLSLEFLNIFEAKLMDLTKSTNFLTFTFNLRIKEEMVQLKVKSANFVLVNPSLQSQEIIDFADTDKLNVGENYSLVLLSPTIDSQQFNQEVKTFCFKEDGVSYIEENEFICKNLNLINTPKETIEGINFIENVVTMEGKNQVILENTVLVFIIKN